MEFSFKRFSPSCQLPDVGLLILRHGPRSGGKFPRESEPLSTEGAESVTQLALKWKNSSRPNRLLSSPLERCLETAEILNTVCDWNQRIVESRLLGGHGAFVVDSRALGSQLSRLSDGEGRNLFISHMRGEDVAGMRDLAEGSKLILDELYPASKAELVIAISHETIIAALGAYLGDDPTKWPEPMSGVHVVRKDES